MPASRDTCLLFTKQFPFGIQENYLFNELDALLAGFKRVVLIPLDEHEYNPAENRMPAMEGLELLHLNRLPAPGISRMARERAVMAVLLAEWTSSRERGMMFRRRKVLAAILRHLYRNAYALNMWIRSEGLTPDNAICYHYWFHNSLVLTWLMETYAGGIHLPQVARAHSGDLYHRDWNVIQGSKGIHIPLEQLKWKQADRVFTISDHGYQFVQRTFPQYARRTAVARLGVRDHGFAPRDPVSGMRTLVTCSLLSPNKRLHELPAILAHVHQPIRWVHFGEGSELKKQHIADELSRLAPHHRVEFAGRMPNHEVIAFYRSHEVDLIVNLSRAEGIPVALMEAASFGVPMLATATVGNPEIVNDVNGILIPVEFRHGDVAARINSLLDDTEAWKACSLAARRTFEMAYHAGNNYAVFTRMLKEFEAD